MTKDYAKRKHSTNSSNSNSRGKRSNAPKSALVSFIWLSLGMLFGLLMAGFIYWKTHQIRTPVSVDNYGAPVQALKDVQIEKSSATRFDFYTLLPNMGVDVGETLATTKSYETKPDALPLKPRPSIKGTAQHELVVQPFIIQVASFKHHNQAETLKAQLALSGFESNIQAVTFNQSERWYRLYLGPFPDRLSARETQKKLESEQKMNSLILKMNV